ncbi:MAG: GAF domain-containing protein [Haloferacaceae archaeon]
MSGRVLCVDPDPDERAATADALRTAGFAVTAVGSAGAARDALDGDPDCIVTETSLPDGDGMEVVVAARERDPDVGAVLFTAAGYAEVDTDRYDEVVEVVPKGGPAARETLAAVVETTVAERSQTDYPLPADEAGRLEALATYDLDDEATLAALDRLTALAVAHFGVERASINVIGEDEQRLLACQGLAPRSDPRSESVCTFTILEEGATVIEDVREDPRLDGEAVVETFDIVAYAGARLVNPEGHALGTFCLYDDEPRSFGADEVRDLERFAAEAAEQLELRRRLSGKGGDVRIEPGGDG